MVRVGPNVQTLCPSCFVKIQVFEGLLKHCFCLLKHYLWWKFQQNQAVFVGVRAQKNHWRAISWMLHRYAKLWKILTWQPQMLYWWNSRLCIFIITLIWQKVEWYYGSLVKVLYKLDLIWESYLWKTTQRRSKMIASGITPAFDEL